MANKQELDDFLAPLEVSKEKLDLLTDRLASTYSQLALQSEDQFLATPVTKLPTGEERGEFLAIDLGGSNLRVAFVNLLGAKRLPGRRFSLSKYDERIEKYHQKSWPIAETLKDEKAEDLFAWIGDCLAEVISERHASTPAESLPAEIPLGITFSFPMKQSTLSEATLLPMGKGFSITSNPDLGALMIAGYARHTSSSTAPGGRALPPVRLAAIANDSVTTLISLSYTTRAKPGSKAVIGLILGTGTNAACSMPPSALAKEKVRYATNGAETDPATVVVNTEWTIRGVMPAMREAGVWTQWDAAQDKDLPTPGFQPFEYTTAGSYLGEVVRLAVVDFFTSRMNVERSDLPPALRERRGLGTTFLCWNVGPVADAKILADGLNKSEGLTGEKWLWDETRAEVLLRVERAVLRRSQGLIAVAIIALLVACGEVSFEKNGAAHGVNGTNGVHNSNGVNGTNHDAGGKERVDELVVAYCGGLICQYTGYVEQVTADMKRLRDDLLAEKHIEVVLKEASEGGVIGAGVLAGTVVAK